MFDMHGAPWRSVYGVVMATLLLGACDPMANVFEPAEAAQLFTSATFTEAPPPSGTIKVLTWNIRFGGARLDFFFDCIGNVHTVQRAQVTAHLTAIADRVNLIGPDIVLLQEADLDSKRSAYQGAAG